MSPKDRRVVSRGRRGRNKTYDADRKKGDNKNEDFDGIEDNPRYGKNNCDGSSDEQNGSENLSDDESHSESSDSDEKKNGVEKKTIKDVADETPEDNRATLNLWDFGQCDAKKCSGRKLHRLGKVRLLRTNKKFHGIILRLVSLVSHFKVEISRLVSHFISFSLDISFRIGKIQLQ